MVLHVVQERAYQIQFLGSPVLISLLLFDNGPALTPWDLLHVAGLDANKNGGKSQISHRISSRDEYKYART
jgi:hypothetical protein